MLGVDHLVPRPGIALAQEMDDFVAARTADDAVGVETPDIPDRRAQGGVVRRRIPMQVADRAFDRLTRRGGGPNGFSFDDSLRMVSWPATLDAPPT